MAGVRRLIRPARAGLLAGGPITMRSNDVSKVSDGRQRVIIESVLPQVDEVRFAIKRVCGDAVIVEADIFTDGHDAVCAILKYRHEKEPDWQQTAMESMVNDHWRGVFLVGKIGTYFYTLEAAIDHFQSWRRDLEKKFKARLDVAIELETGAEIIAAAAARAMGAEAEELSREAHELSAGSGILPDERVAVALRPRIAELMARHSERRHVTRYPKELRVTVDPEIARFAAWYEMFPRSAAREPGRHGTLADVEALLPRISEMGFDVLYLPPIHPIGKSFRKGQNNSLEALPGAPGSPWAIGSEEGGHKSIHPQLGTLDDFRRLVKRAAEFKVRLALDIAFQCSPDHPYVREHPNWFRLRSDGSIQYAENPPKTYQDIYPLNFETEDWRGLWKELKSIFEFWIEQDVRMFRVDNPHTKAFGFWEWCIGELKRAHPDLVFLAEAFTRPKVMNYLAKLGFTQSYNYFPWRNTRYELTTHFTELEQSGVREYFRPSLWPNTPDILTQYLQFGGRPAFMARLVLAAMLGASYGIYGPPFELSENTPRESGSEEYLNSEKYEIRHWDRDAPGNLSSLISLVNRIRRENPALQRDDRLRFHETDNEQIIVYSKDTEDLSDIVLVVVNLDPHHIQSGWLRLSLDPWGIGPRDNFQVHDLLTGSRYLWKWPNELRGTSASSDSGAYLSRAPLHPDRIRF